MLKSSELKRNLSIDFYRGIALLLVVLYHLSVLSGKSLFNIPFIDNFIVYGGEIGVTLFFIISGYGIYTSLNKNVEKESVSLVLFLKKRLKRVVPPYYICLFVLIFLSSGAMFLSKRGMLDVFSHLTFTHNLTHLTHGTINGALWTMGTIVQFYFISYFVYKLIKKWNLKFLLLLLPITIFMKYIFYAYILSKYTNEGVLFFIYGRQLIFCLDNFVLGMFLAKWFGERKLYNRNFKLSLIGLVFSVSSLFIGLNYFNSSSLYDGSIISASFHTILALLLSMILYFTISLNLQYKSNISKGILIYAKYEYETYLWHLIIIQMLLTSPWFKTLVSSSNIMMASIFVLFITFIFGYFSKKMINAIDFALISRTIREKSTIIFNCICIIAISFMLNPVIKSLEDTRINGQAVLKGNVQQNDALAPVVQNISSLGLTTNESTKTIYVDKTNEEGYMNYYRIKYYLTNFHITTSYSTYINHFYYEDEKEILNFIRKNEFEYLIVKDSTYLEKQGFKIDKIKGSVFLKRKGNYNTVKDYLIPVEEVK